MSAFDDRMRTRNADKAQALGAVAAVLAAIDASHREPNTWERLCVLRAFSLIASGCYLLAVMEARDASMKPNLELDDRCAETVIETLELPVMFEALRESMAEDARLYPHLGPMALG